MSRPRYSVVVPVYNRPHELDELLNSLTTQDYKNFEVIGVSLDDKKDLWLKAINDNHFDWIQVCDFKGRQNDVAVAYGISAIPQSLLVDPNGIIIAKNLRGDDLIEKLEEVIKTNN